MLVGVHSLVATLVLLTMQCRGKPIDLKSQNKAVKFMQQYGYISKPVDGLDSIFTEEYFREKVTKLQKFGNIPQTGELDEETLKLIDTPRCGLPDLNPEEIEGNHLRRKRYILGSEGWNKRNLTYYIANWSGKLRSKENVQSELRRAFDTWSVYSNLRFTEVDASQSQNADIVIYFAEYDHQDGYPFDGPSGTLAHAYYPHEFGHYGGDVHFDESEKWTINPKDEYEGLDFFTVAVHELGHSLGLSHSPVGGSIMAPYYKGFNPNLALDYDDILAMWDLYIRRKLEGDDELAQYPSSSSSTTSTSTTTMPTTTPVDEDAERKRWEEEVRRKEEETRKREAEERRKWEEEEMQRDEAWTKAQEGDKTTTIIPVPDLCDGDFDAIGIIRQELFIFKGQYLWRFTERNQLRQGYPDHIRNMFPGLPEDFQKLDAVYEREAIGEIVFLIGNNFFVHDGSKVLEGYPKPISEFDLPEEVDSAFVWPKDNNLYFLSGNMYWAYNETTQMMDAKGSMSHWNGLPTGIQAAFTYTDGNSYFFKGKDYWRYDNQNMSPDSGYPRDATLDWASC